MSASLNGFSRQIEQNTWRRLFGDMIQECRRQTGLSLEEAGRHGVVGVGGDRERS